MNQAELNDEMSELLKSATPNIKQIEQLIQEGAEIDSKALKNACSKG